MHARSLDTTTHRRGAPRLRQAPLRPLSILRPAPEALADEARLRDAGGPDDRAFYRCGCGTAFRADVSTSVSCPGCGGQQAW